MKLARLLVNTMMALFVMAVAPAQQVNDGTNAEVAFRAALQQENVKGDLKAAIQQYQKILEAYPQDRSVAAKALLHIGECYEKLGQSEASTAYQRLLRDYADQSAEANEARARLAEFSRGSRGVEMVAQRLWAGPEADVEGGVSADGRLLSYVDWDTGDLAVRDLATGQNRLVTHKGSWADSSEFAEASVPSPNGAQIAYAWYNKDNFYELRVINTDGSNMRVLYRNPEVDYLEPKSWSPDGKEIVGTFWDDRDQKGQIMEVSTADGSTRTLRALKLWGGGGGWFHAMFSPDGRYVAYDLPPAEGSMESDIYSVASDGGAETPLVQGPSDDLLLGWTPDGRGIVFVSDRLGSYAVWTIDVRDGKPSGSPRLLNANVGLAWPLGVSRDGSLYYGINTGVTDVYTASFDFNGGKMLQPPTLVSPEHAGRNVGGAWSPDGRYLAFLSRRRRLSGYWLDTIVVQSLESGQERLLSPNLSTIFPALRASWSANGLAFYVAGADKSGRMGIFRVDGQTGDASSLFGNDHDFEWARRIEELPLVNSFVLQRQDHGKQTDAELILRKRDTGQERVLFHIAHPAKIFGFAVSTDGQQVAFITGDEPGGTSALRVIPVAGGDARVLFRSNAPQLFQSDSLAWTRDDSQIVFVKTDGRLTHDKSELMEIGANGGEPRDLGLSMPRMARVGIHPDGHRIVFQTHSITGEVWVIRNLFVQAETSH
jgi:Tol biopolymer transport system component